MSERIKELYGQAALFVFENKVGVEGVKETLQEAINEKFVELLAGEAFRAGLLYAAKKYESVREDRFIGADVAMFLEMESRELTDKEIAEHFGVK